METSRVHLKYEIAGRCKLRIKGREYRLAFDLGKSGPVLGYPDCNTLIASTPNIVTVLIPRFLLSNSRSTLLTILARAWRKLVPIDFLVSGD
jgi:hypothetical protein